MVIGIILAAALLAAVLFALHYGYKLAFYYDDPCKDPFDYGKEGQIAPKVETLEKALRAFCDAPFEEVHVRSLDGLKLRAKYYHHVSGAPLEIHCHGYKGNAMRDFCGGWAVAKASGHNVLLIDQRSHGKSEGHTITFGVKEKTDVLQWIHWANERFGEVPIILSGVSMGAATVLMAAGMELPGNVKAVIADCPFDSPANIIKTVMERNMGMPVGPVYPLVRLGGMVYGHFDLESDSAVEAVKRAKLPILLIHGDDDRFVPYSMSQNIHAAAPEKITFHTVPEAGHAMNYIWDPEGYHRVVRAFTDKVLH